MTMVYYSVLLLITYLFKLLVIAILIGDYYLLSYSISDHVHSEFDKMK